ncbi:glycosyltransferase [Glycomyces sp. TRM65418]|uniref:glycosyltransferase n=1 Tax=Glycomyces sp. TRM65418 TaxID=2867006 RepID=UPI001CE613D9|nr:glycosyltransferase [Glycomyces sp. TRM65418]MCC3762791.1 glycosyltransferase [Glycomyces sp. TRM65418]QZD56821.1 glycosyltransferase [Glycomyces sp. TRM65418]
MAVHPQRIVMLVQNGVTGDSRIQKEAESAAAAGYAVTLLGVSPDRRPQEWTLGEAEVRLVPVDRVFDRRRHEMRRGWLRSPLAYPPGPLAAYRNRQARAWRTDLDTERDLRGPGLGATLALAPREAAYRLFWGWTGLRRRATRRLEQRRAAAAAPIDRAAASFWKAVAGDRAWRRLDPALWDLELSFAPVIDELRPDLIHANDFQMLGVGARAKLRAARRGREIKLVWDAHEYLPGMKAWKNHPWWKDAQLGHEREFAPHADAVVTVSDTLASMMRERHRLPETPEVVMNVPDFGDADEAPDPSLRERCGIGPGTPLMVYSGAPLEQRGLHILVEALPSLPGIHAAFIVSKPHWRYVLRLQSRAAELGVADRVHVLEYVPHRQVVPFLAEADLGVIPIHHWGNHEISLITKFFEYAHARLPIVVSDVKTMSALVRRTGQGEVFRAEDTEDFIRAVKAVLEDPETYRKAYAEAVPLEEWTWASQSTRLIGVYRRLLGAATDEERRAQ